MLSKILKMNTAIKIPIQSLNPVVVKDLQEKYPKAVVQIEVEQEEGKSMDERKFWEIIALLDWGRKRNEDVISPAVESLSQLSEQDLFEFDQILAEKLFALDGEKYAKPLGWGDSSGRSFSPDVFLYSRCCAVANGKVFYEKVFQDPSLMPKEFTFEPILFLSEKAHLLKTGNHHYDYLPSISYETFSNHDGWSNRPPLSNFIKGKVA